jgi:predicted enzyme related to lactoylglutathione lyase
MSEQDPSPCSQPGQFSWNELVTTDVEGATAFYSSLFGWTTTAFSPEYTLFKKDGRDVAGLMKTPQPGMPAQWVAYITVEDVDATAGKAETLGGKIILAPMDVPDVGRIAVLLDPQNAPIGIFKPQF